MTFRPDVLAVLVRAHGVTGPLIQVDPWRFHWHPEVDLVMGSAAALYLFAITRWGRSLPAGSPVVTRRQVVQFCAGLGLLWLFAEYPVHDISERYLYSVHMVQHIVFSLIAPPLLILGTPQWLQRRLLRPRWVGEAWRGATGPLVAGVTFNAVVAVTHWPALVDFSLEHQVAHFFVHLTVFTASMMMWFPVLNKMPDYPLMSPPQRMIYLFLQSILPTIPASFLTFAEGPVYRFYATVPRPFALGLIDDQQIAGAIMKVGEAALLWAIIVVMFFRWYRNDGDFVMGRPSPLSWQDVAAELDEAVGESTAAKPLGTRLTTASAPARSRSD